jgi:uncharacterized membrane protein YphA (DoxX/SURF4 family)
MLKPFSADVGGWVLRGGVAIFVVLMGLEKFSSGPGAPWAALFEQIGLGQWLGYLTGVVEVGAGILYVQSWRSVTRGVA